jgi:hypothetical protein
MVRFVLLDTDACLLQTTTFSGAKMAVLIFPQQSPIYGRALISVKRAHITILANFSVLIYSKKVLKPYF